MRIGSWLSLVFAGAMIFVVGCAAPSGGYAKKGGRMSYAQDDAGNGAKKRVVGRMKKRALLAAPAEEPAPDEPAARPAPAATQPAAAAPEAAPAPAPEREPLTEEEKKALEDQL